VEESPQQSAFIGLQSFDLIILVQYESLSTKMQPTGCCSATTMKCYVSLFKVESFQGTCGTPEQAKHHYSSSHFIVGLIRHHISLSRSSRWESCFLYAASVIEIAFQSLCEKALMCYPVNVRCICFCFGYN